MCIRDRFNHVVENGDGYRLIFGYTEDVSRFNYGFVHGSKTKIGNLIVGWNEDSQTIVVVPTVPDLSGCGDPTFYRRSEILKAYRNKYPTDAFVIYPDKMCIRDRPSLSIYIEPHGDPDIDDGKSHHGNARHRIDGADYDARQK